MRNLAALFFALAVALPALLLCADESGGSGIGPRGDGVIQPDATARLGANSTCNPVSEYNADGTGRTNTLPSIQDCANRVQNREHVNVHLPGGTYHINDTLILGYGQCLEGDGKGLTTITIDADFNPAAEKIIGTNGDGEQKGPCIRNLTINFVQPTDQAVRANFKTLAEGCTTGVGGSGCKYPWAIDTGTSSRWKIYDVDIYAAWNGIKGNPAGSYLDRINLGALNIGWSADGALDWVHSDQMHIWPFGMLGGLSTIYFDGSTVGAQMGHVEGFTFTDFNVIGSKLNFTDGNSFGKIIGLNLDANAQLNVSAGTVQIAGLYASQSATHKTCQITNSGGVLQITNILSSSGGAPSVCSSGGQTEVTGGQMVQNGAVSNVPMTSQAGTSSIFKMNGVTLWPAVFNDGNTPVLKSTATGDSRTFLTANVFGSSTQGPNPGIAIATDNTANLVSGNAVNGWGFTPPGLLGNYSDVMTGLPSFEVGLSADQPAAIGGNTVVVFDKVLKDSNKSYNSKTGAFTPRKAGTYEIKACLTGRGTFTLAPANIATYIQKNSSVVAQGVSSVPSGAGLYQTVCADATVTMNGTSDYIIAALFTTATSAVVAGNGFYVSKMSGHRIGS